MKKDLFQLWAKVKKSDPWKKHGEPSCADIAWRFANRLQSAACCDCWETIPGITKVLPVGVEPQEGKV